MNTKLLKTFFASLVLPAQFFLFGIIFLELVLAGSVARWVSIPWIVLVSVFFVLVGLWSSEEKQKRLVKTRQKVIVLCFATIFSLAIVSFASVSFGFAIPFLLVTLFLTNSLLDA